MQWYSRPHNGRHETSTENTLQCDFVRIIILQTD